MLSGIRLYGTAQHRWVATRGSSIKCNRLFSGHRSRPLLADTPTWLKRSTCHPDDRDRRTRNRTSEVEDAGRVMALDLAHGCAWMIFPVGILHAQFGFVALCADLGGCISTSETLSSSIRSAAANACARGATCPCLSAGARSRWSAAARQCRRMVGHSSSSASTTASSRSTSALHKSRLHSERSQAMANDRATLIIHMLAWALAALGLLVIILMSF